MIRTIVFALIGIVCLGASAGAQSYGKAERRDPLFLRFPEMADRYWERSETSNASTKVVAIPMPKQCAFLYADANYAATLGMILLALLMIPGGLYVRATMRSDKS